MHYPPRRDKEKLSSAYQEKKKSQKYARLFKRIVVSRSAPRPPVNNEPRRNPKERIKHVSCSKYYSAMYSGSGHYFERLFFRLSLHGSFIQGITMI